MQPSPETSARRPATHSEAARAAERVFVTAHPSEPATSTALRAGEAALKSSMDRTVERGAAPDGQVALAALFARHLAERLPDDSAGVLHATVVAAAITAAVDLALTEWSTAGARADGVAACRERFRSVAALLPPEPGHA